MYIKISLSSFLLICYNKFQYYSIFSGVDHVFGMSNTPMQSYIFGLLPDQTIMLGLEMQA